MRDVKMIEMPRTFERGHADEADGRQPVEREKSWSRPAAAPTSSSARPKTGDGLASGNRCVAMMSSRNGRMVANEGNCAATLARRGKIVG